jgi:hypothetical protein
MTVLSVSFATSDGACSRPLCAAAAQRIGSITMFLEHYIHDAGEIVFPIDSRHSADTVGHMVAYATAEQHHGAINLEKERLSITKWECEFFERILCGLTPMQRIRKLSQIILLCDVMRYDSLLDACMHLSAQTIVQNRKELAPVLGLLAITEEMRQKSEEGFPYLRE